MENKQKLQKLIYAYDLHKSNLKIEVPKVLCEFTVQDHMIENDAKSFNCRCTVVAWDFCFLAFQQEYPNGDLKEFEQKFVGTKNGLNAFRVAVEEVSKILPEKITAQELSEFQKECQKQVTSA